MIKQAMPLPQDDVPLQQWGIMLHTTGDGPPRQALAGGLDPYDEALRIYESMGRVGPHFLVGPLGQVAQLRDPRREAFHVKTTLAQRRDFLNGNWTTLVKPDVVRWWRARWPGQKSPQHLFPAQKPRSNYIGIEMIPCGTWPNQSGNWTPFWADPFGGTRFSGATYLATAELVLQLAGAYDINTLDRRKLLGHEDVNPVTRPGWDPGDMTGGFSWNLFNGLLTGLKVLRGDRVAAPGGG